jgi:hypothetical protein
MNAKPQGLPLRPDHAAQREAALIAIARACVNFARAVGKREMTNHWPEDRQVELLMRGAMTATSMADATALATIAMQFVSSLTPISAAAALISRSLQLTFDRAAQISVPSLTLPNAAFIGEGEPIPVVAGNTLPPALLDPHKLATIVPLTNEMIYNTNAEAIVRQALTENVGAALDAALFSTAAAVPGTRPPGILNGVTPLAASAAAPVDAMVEDIAAIAAALAPAAGGASPVLIAAPAQAAALTLRTSRDFWPVLASNALPNTSVIGIVPAALATAVETPRIEAGPHATLHFEDTTPGEIVDVGGVLAAPAKSMFQTVSVGPRFILPVTWARRSPDAVAWIDSTKW